MDHVGDEMEGIRWEFARERFSVQIHPCEHQCIQSNYMTTTNGTRGYIGRGSSYCTDRPISTAANAAAR